MIVDYLANHKQFIPEIADLIFGEWSDLFLANGVDKAQLLAMLEERANTERLPIAYVAVRDGELLGTGSIKMEEPSTREGLSPWLAGMYIKEAYRGGGVGEQIVKALEAKAQALGVETMYLSVGRAVSFYRRLGWSIMEERVTPSGATLMSKRLAA
ncbi:GNAT family N-acetyltransferase [Massilia sp. ZL223]|uniref:GNAT family N-acetyltransferase n=1 Tax=Massilia sp. ZL223 TaxID=2824904 RepID=UPI001B81B2BE|nr:GNAT family N-acetyltransferase [Massilia sp. ZL223]MBQ5963338.1 GNAT family N-acetyltransferase [Massilia sp. ZL223]